MASSSRGSEGADEVGNQIPEDLVLSWTRDATTSNAFGTFVENDRQLLEELIQCVHKEKDANATKQKLSVLLSTGKDRKSVVIRARVLTRLIAIALDLHPNDIAFDSETRKESLSPSVDFQTALRARLAEALQHNNTVLSYLFKDALEADDEVMTVIFCDPRFFKKYQVPYFHGCDLLVVQEISNLWLSQEFRRGFYYYSVLEPLVNQLKAEQLEVEAEQSKVRAERWEMEEEQSEVRLELWEMEEEAEQMEVKAKQLQVKAEQLKVKVEQLEVKAEQLQAKAEQLKVENLLKATMMLCELLQRRTVKAGARLLQVMLSGENDTTYREVVQGLVIPLVRFKNGTGNGKFRKCFLGDFENLAREARWHSRGSDQERGRHGHSITVGPSSAQTDPNLLCWAARRGYFNLIWCISLGYTEARPIYPSENLLEDATEALSVSLLWKMALWCATRHGKDSVVMELARPSWVKRFDFNDYTGVPGCLPPLHLVSLLGDRSLLRVLRMCEVGIESGAHKTDYLGKTPLDYAMQFQLTTRNSKEGMQFQFQALNNEFKEWTQPRPLARYSTIGIPPPAPPPAPPPYYRGGMPMPTPEHQSCTQQLLQMPGVADRLKELNDMYITQANFVLIGAALIASVAFAGFLQPPLGYADYFQFTQPSPPAPAGTYEQYVAVEGHLCVQLFVVFNALSFFLGIGTMLIGAEATLFFHDNDERTIALMKVRKSIKWMLGFFITSMVCIMAAFVCAGLAILPPIQRLEWSMIVSLCLGACICLIPLTWIFSSLAGDQIVKLQDQIVKLKDQMVKLIMQFDKEKKLDDSLKCLDDSLKDLCESLVNDEDMKTLQDEMERKLQVEKRKFQDYMEKKEEWKMEKREEKREEKKEEKKEEKREEWKVENKLSRQESYNSSLEDGPLDYGRSLFSMY